MGIEAMVEAANVLFDDRFVATIENVEFDSPFKFYRDAQRTVNVRAFFELDGEALIARCQLEGIRQLHGQAEPQVTTHFRSRVRLTREKAAPVSVKAPGKSKGAVVGKDELYKLYFHGPAYQVMEKVWKSGKRIIGEFAAKLPDNHAPADRLTLADPRLIELCFQTAGVWEMGAKDRMGLPYRIAQVRFIRPATGSKAKLFAVVTAKKDDSYDADVVDSKGQVYLQLLGYRTMALPESMEAKLLEPLKSLVK